NLYCARYLQPAGCSCDTAGAWTFSWPQFQKIDSMAAANGLMTEYYFGWPSSGRIQSIASRADRLLIHAYRTSDVDIYQYTRNRLIDATTPSRTVKVIPIFSAESSFMGPWLASNPITKPYQTYSTALANETSSFKTYVNLQGYQWFNYTYLPKTTLATATITASGPTSFCTGGSVTLTANSGSTYRWSPGNQTTRSITVTTSGNYTVSVTNSSGQTATSTPTTVTVTSSLATPTITASGPTSFCTGGTVTLSTAASGSYRWSNGATTQSIAVTASGNYTVTVTSGSCSATSTATSVNVVAPPSTPTVTASGSLSVCPGAGVTLTSSSATSYQWSTGATTRAIVATVAGTYWVRVFSSSNCYSQSGNQVVTLLIAPAKPVISANGQTVLSNNNRSVTLSSSPANNYSWNTNATTSSISATTAGSYRVSTTGANGCISTSDPYILTSTTCTPPPTPSITLSGSNVVVSGQTVKLTATTGTGWLWSNGATTQSINVSSAGTYTVNAYSGSGCFSISNPVTIYVVAAIRGHVTALDDEQFNIYPNPATNRLNLVGTLQVEKSLQFRMIDFSGKEMISETIMLVPGSNSLSFDVSAFSRGIYTAILQDDDTTDAIRIVLQ
ncbi:MAG: T9SS type A sorting domain-containing protein, partial [Bacteroidota bacterium]